MAAPIEPTPLTKPAAADAARAPPASCAAAPESSASGPNKSPPTSASPSALATRPSVDSHTYASSAAASASNERAASAARDSERQRSESVPTTITPSTPPSSNALARFAATSAAYETVVER